jgi:hypothetical protein
MPPTSPTNEEIESRFRYHAPTPEARRRHEAITEASIAFAKVIRDNVPFGRGQSLALTATEEARMWANQGIATNHGKLGEPKP